VENTVLRDELARVSTVASRVARAEYRGGRPPSAAIGPARRVRFFRGGWLISAGRRRRRRVAGHGRTGRRRRLSSIACSWRWRGVCSARLPGRLLLAKARSRQATPLRVGCGCFRVTWLRRAALHVCLQAARMRAAFLC
jgi:hypothetical protein